MNNLKMKILGIFVLAVLLFSPNVYAEEVGTLGEYYTMEEALEVASNAQVDNDEEKVETSIVTEQREYIENSVSLDQTFATNIGATVASEAFKAAYTLLGYDEESATIETIIITESSTEERTFNSIAEILAYRSLLQTAGYDVSIRITNLGLTTTETNQENVDASFESILDLFRYLLDLASNHNNFQIAFENNSYIITIDEDVSQVFESRIEAYAYLRNLRSEYTVSNEEVIYNDEPTEVIEHIQQYFESSTDAEEAYDNLQSNDYSLENKEIKVLSINELENQKSDIIDSLTLNNDEVAYSSISTISTNVNVTFEDETGEIINANGTVRVNEIIINGNSYSPLLLTGIALLELPNNTVAQIKGTITTDYCTAYRTLFGARICTAYKTIDFESYGLINIDRNNSQLPFDFLSDNVFYYSITDYDDIEKIISDNLIYIYQLDVDKVTTFTNPTYTVNAHIHNENLVREYRVYGSVSQINLIPEYTLEITRSRDVERYHAAVNMVKKSVQDVYIVNYVRTLITPNTEEVIDIPITPTNTVIDENTMNSNEANPQTYDNIIFYIMGLALSTIGLGISSKKLGYFKN